jgi:hypothetical protein
MAPRPSRVYQRRRAFSGRPGAIADIDAATEAAASVQIRPISFAGETAAAQGAGRRIITVGDASLTLGTLQAPSSKRSPTRRSANARPGAKTGSRSVEEVTRATVGRIARCLSPLLYLWRSFNGCASSTSVRVRPARNGSVDGMVDCAGAKTWSDRVRERSADPTAAASRPFLTRSEHHVLKAFSSSQMGIATCVSTLLGGGPCACSTMNHATLSSAARRWPTASLNRVPRSSHGMPPHTDAVHTEPRRRRLTGNDRLR